MPDTEPGGPPCGAPGRDRVHWNPSVPYRTIVIQATALAALALVSAWLLQRWDSISGNRHFKLQSLAQADLIAQAAQPETLPGGTSPRPSLAGSARLIRILECSARGGNILAGAVLDSSGTVIAHTDLSRIGTKTDFRRALGGGDAAQSAGMAAKLFAGTSGEFLVQPVLGPRGVDGAVALVLPRSAFTAGTRRLLLYLFPAGVVLLAFLAVNQAAVRSARKRASESISQVARAAGLDAACAHPACTPRADAQVVQDTVSRVQSIAQTNDELILTNRLLKFENTRMRMILDHFPDGLIVTDKMNNVTFVNRKAMRIVGIAADGGHDGIVEEPPVELLRTIREVDRSGRVLIPSAAGGAERQVLCSKAPLSTATGKQTGTLYAMRDVTAQQSTVRVQTEFLSQITHELKAPLNTVVACAETLADGGERGWEERKKLYDAIRSEANRMGHLISNLLQLSRIQLGNLSSSFDLVRPGPLIKDQVESLKIQAEGNGLSLDLRIPENLPAVRGDKDLLGLAVGNLISNALTYTGKGGTITVRAEAEEAGVLIEVVDTGIGIPDEIRPRVFDRFFRSDQDLVRQKPGSGLGLSLVKEIVDLHNGKVTVESGAGSGTRFMIRLPTLEVGSRLEPAAAAA